MTNLCAELAIYSLVVTQWTGFTLNNKEAGVVVTNYEARVSFEGKTNAMPLKTELSGVVVWRENQAMNMFLTNGIQFRHPEWRNVSNFLYRDASPYTLEIR